MDQREARRHVRRSLAEHARQLADDPGVIGDPDARASIVTAFRWVAEWLAPAGETSPLPENLRPLVHPDGSPVEQWSHLHGPGSPDPEPRSTDEPGA